MIAAYTAADWAAVALMALVATLFIGAWVLAVRRIRGQTGLRGWQLARYILGIAVPVLAVLILVRVLTQ